MTDADGNPTDERDSRTNASDADGGRMGTTGLVCSILGVVTCGLWLLSIPGLVLSLVAMRAAAARARRRPASSSVRSASPMFGLAAPAPHRPAPSVAGDGEACRLDGEEREPDVPDPQGDAGDARTPIPAAISRSPAASTRVKDPRSSASRRPLGHVPTGVDPGSSREGLAPVVKSDGPDRVPDTEDDTPTSSRA